MTNFRQLMPSGEIRHFASDWIIFPSKLLSGVMNENMEAIPAESAALGKARHRLRVVRFGVVVVLLYLLAVYVVTPSLWKRDVRRHPELFNAPRITHTPNGILGDPLNVALVGSESDLIHAMIAAKWYPADALTFRSSLLIAVDSVFHRPDDDAPVSTLELFGRKQDLAFEQPVGGSPRQRHHVRFWRWDQRVDGREVWFGAVTFDERVGLSHTTGQVTHHIGPDIDAERDRLGAGLREAKATERLFWLDDFQQLGGKNGGGDPWYSDGRLEVIELVTISSPSAATTNDPAKP